jgi:hypothetical protein
VIFGYTDFRDYENSKTPSTDYPDYTDSFLELLGHTFPKEICAFCVICG